MHQERIGKVLSAMREKGLDQVLVSDPDSIWFLTGYDVFPGKRLLALCLRQDGRYEWYLNKIFPEPEGAYKQTRFSDTDDFLGMLAQGVAPQSSVGVDKNWPARFLLPLIKQRPDCQYMLASDCVDEIRACKDAVERDLMREASRINDVVMERTMEFIKEGISEKEVAEYILSEYVAEGCEGGSFEPLVCFGANAADSHHKSGNTRLKDGDGIVIDTGCRKDRYCSDMTRTFFCKSADPKYVMIYELVREANELAERMIRPGVPLCEIDGAARTHIAAAGYGEYFTHRLGHFIGQRVHEQGDVSATSSIIAEPGIYLPGEFGVRIEDLVLVTEDGCEILNHVDKRVRYVG